MFILFQFFNSFFFQISWRRNSKFSRFIKLKKSISKRILQNVPSYSEALIAISKLIQEIIVIKFLPFGDEKLFVEKTVEDETTKTPKLSPNNTRALIERVRLRKMSELPKQKVILYKTFSLEEFLSQVSELNVKSDDLLNYFFIYVKYILSCTREKMFNKLRFYERLVHQTDPL